MNLINKDQIISVQIYRKKESERFSIVNRRIKWFRKETRSVVRDNYSFKTASIEAFNNCPGNYYIENNVVYIKPYLEINVCNSSTLKFRFENSEELDNWIKSKSLLDKHKFIEL